MLAIKPVPHWLKASALTTASSLPPNQFLTYLLASSTLLDISAVFLYGKWGKAY